MKPEDGTLAGARCLLTGGAGYLGHSLTRELLLAGAHVRRMFRPRPHPPAATGPNVENVEGDVTRREDLERACADVDIVFHLAAQTSLYVADADPRADFEANVRPLTLLLDLAVARAEPPMLLFAGTATQIGLTTTLPIERSRPDAPVTAYDLHKLWAEQYLELWTRAHGIVGTTLRLCNVYGPGPPSSSSDRGVINQMVRRALKGDTLTIYGDGHQVRDYVCVDDVARAFVAAAKAPSRVNGRHFVIGTGQGHSIAHAVGRIAAIVGERLDRVVPVGNVAPPATLSSIENRSFVADPREFEEASGFRPSITLDQGLKMTLEHFLSQEKAS